MTKESVNVLVSIPISETSLRGDWLSQIAATSLKIKARDVSSLVSAEARGNLSSKEQLDALLAEAEVIYGRKFPKNLIARAPKLKWIQIMSAGVDTLTTDIMRSQVILTSSRGINATAVSEVILERMLMFAKQAPLCFRLKQEKQWSSFIPTELHFKIVGILGLGSIGQKVARLAKAFGMRVVAIDVKRVKARCVDVVLSPKQLNQLLSESDFVVITLPLTPATQGLIGEGEFQIMKPTAYLINTARGAIVDEEALIHALDEHWISGAGLDVFAIEPLPIDSRLWGLPNVIFSPHIAGGSEDRDTRMTELFCENLRRYVNGKKLLNVINKKRGF